VTKITFLVVMSIQTDLSVVYERLMVWQKGTLKGDMSSLFFIMVFGREICKK